MAKKKIIVVDVDIAEPSNDTDIVTVDNNKETASDTPEETDTKDENITEKDIKYEDITEEVKEKTREQTLVKCEKCNKFVTAKTLRYTHGAKCGEVKRSRPKKELEKELEIVEVKPDKPDKPVKLKKPPGLELPPKPIQNHLMTCVEREGQRD